MSAPTSAFGKPPVEVGARWAYRESSRRPVHQVEIVLLSPPRLQKARIRHIDGEYPGLEEWVPRRRLLVLWDEAEAWVHDEERFSTVLEASYDAKPDPTERMAAWYVGWADPRPDGMSVGPSGAVRISNAQEFASLLGMSLDELFVDPLAFVDRRGAYWVPWTTGLRLAHRVCDVLPEVVLRKVAEEEAKLQRESVEGRLSLSYKDVWVPAEVCAERYRDEQPIFAMVRSWCRAEDVAQFDEMQALRAENARLRGAIESAIGWFERLANDGEANALRSEIGMPILRKWGGRPRGPERIS